MTPEQQQIKARFARIFRKTPVKVLRDNMKRDLRSSFGWVPPFIEASLSKIEEEIRLLQLHKAALHARSICDFVAAFESKPQRISLADRLPLQGYLEGYQLGRLTSEILRNLTVRFGEVPAALEEKIENMESITALRKLTKIALLVNSLEEFAARIQGTGQGRRTGNSHAAL